ncbi:MAG: Nif3-like dinuclear metal center hexameric protein [Actinomycetota bacterium]|nr:Nif3-like dinuclear metal center hexameric protein [Actinomycetota bacterium]
MLRLADLIAVLDEWFDPRWAEPWDAVGLVCGDPAERVERILLAVDAVPETVDQALSMDAQLLLTHHPLLLTGVHGIAANDPKGALVHRMVRGRVAHFVAHTNADIANPGVSDALAALLGLTGTVSLETAFDDAFAKLVVFVPSADAQRIIVALGAAGAGSLGDYDSCAWLVEGTGTFRPRAGASPAVGVVGEVACVAESRIEMVVPHPVREDVIRALRATHPYEEPAFDLIAQVPVPSRRGTGRIGDLHAPVALREFAHRVARTLPRTVWGVRAAGDPEQMVRTVAVCGGSGGSLAETARRRGADVLVTSDLKHHTTLETVTERGCPGMALIDVAHWSSEAPWLDALAGRMRDHFGTTVEVHVSRLVTDPWTVHAPSPESSSIST